jgi:hypothetical protein
MSDAERLELAADVLAWTQGYDCLDDDDISADDYSQIEAAAREALAHIDGARG